MNARVSSSGSGAMALVVVDVQEAAVERGPYQAAVVLRNIAALIVACRTAGVEVIYVQHDGQPGEPEEPGTRGWEIHAQIGPAAGEVIIRKRFNSAFRRTHLKPYLDGRGINTLILVGIQTEYCIDTTCRVAFELGYAVIIPEMTNTTFDNGGLSAAQIHDFWNRRIFDGRFAVVLSMADTLQVIEDGAFS